MFDRLVALIGEEMLEKIKSKKVLVLGCGGVGGYVVEGLVRSGIERITIVDKDIVDVTNLNRQIIALNSTLGKYKVDVMKERIEDIDHEAKVVVSRECITEDSIGSLDLGEYDYVVDAIDEVKVKVALAKYALKHDVKLVISTGTARKLDPSKLSMTTLDKTSYDPLAKKMRSLLRGENIKKLTVLASTEQPIETVDNVLGSSFFVPSSGGILIASYIINDIIKE